MKIHPLLSLPLTIALLVGCGSASPADAAKRKPRPKAQPGYVVTRAEYNSIRPGDTVAQVHAKTGGWGLVYDRSDFTIFTGGFGPDATRLAAGPSYTRAYRSPDKAYYPKNCRDWQVVYAQDGGIGPFRVVRKEAWTNICFKRPA